MVDFFHRVVDWQSQHGRHDLPWQNTRDPYRVWLSEIMLQQTQVSTVLAYYPRFVQRFPDVASLAGATLDEVFGLWSGLGYYSRARHLHACAQAVVRVHGGAFPPRAQQLQGLPGIGPSTAAAIAAFCFGERVSILDGNVQRVLSRLLAFDADLAQAAQRRRLWSLAQELLPAQPSAQEMVAYTQGLMDLGAALCTTRAPRCADCPAAALCRARHEPNPQRYPVKTRQLRRSSQSLWLLLARREDAAVWLHRRPATGIWAGLHAVPVFDSLAALTAVIPVAEQGSLTQQAMLVHVLTHKDLHLHPVVFKSRTAPDCAGAWFAATQWADLGLPAPMRRLLEQGSQEGGAADWIPMTEVASSPISPARGGV